MKHNNNENLNFANPSIFTKKVNNKHKVIPLNLTVNTSGPVKHFPPATQEWFNSIYTYNNNSMKNLSVADKNLSNLIKSYFNFYFKKTLKKSERVAMRFRRLAVSKIFVSKAEVKHTSTKVLITLYVHNAEKIILNRKIKQLTGKIIPSANLLRMRNVLIPSEKRKRAFHYVELLNFWWDQYKYVPLLNWFTNNTSSYLKEFILERKKFSTIKKNKKHLKDINLLNRNNLLKGMEQWLDISVLTIKDLLVKKEYLLKNIHKTLYYQYDKFYYIYLYWLNIGQQYKVIKYYKTLLRLNNAKFNYFFIHRLKPLISNIYNKKEVQFNIVNLKNIYFNSDIFTQAIALKLKNRDNRLIRVLRSALYLAKLPKVNIIKERYDETIIKDLWANKVKNFKVDLLLNKYSSLSEQKYNTNKDTLDIILTNILSDTSLTNSSNTNLDIVSNKNNLLDYILRNLKNKNTAGVRLEAKGRLTRRFTASRSVFKIKWKGGIRNIDSSYRGLSAVMLRGHLTSNVQYSQINSKTRNGAFGIKGWVSSK